MASAAHFQHLVRLEGVDRRLDFRSEVRASSCDYTLALWGALWYEAAHSDAVYAPDGAPHAAASRLVVVVRLVDHSGDSSLLHRNANQHRYVIQQTCNFITCLKPFFHKYFCEGLYLYIQLSLNAYFIDSTGLTI